MILQKVCIKQHKACIRHCIRHFLMRFSFRIPKISLQKIFVYLKSVFINICVPQNSLRKIFVCLKSVFRKYLCTSNQKLENSCAQRLGIRLRTKALHKALHRAPHKVEKTLCCTRRLCAHKDFFAIKYSMYIYIYTLLQCDAAACCIRL